ncbi:hypothetical protein DV735_g2698, partial [Chaetothyriales sp. CBS 134920]
MTDKQAIKQPKLRASCDRCGSLKLKCDRTHPSCERCIGEGAKCVYGISRKSNRGSKRLGTMSPSETIDEYQQSDKAQPGNLAHLPNGIDGSGIRSAGGVIPWADLPSMIHILPDESSSQDGDKPGTQNLQSEWDWISEIAHDDNPFHSGVHTPLLSSLRINNASLAYEPAIFHQGDAPCLADHDCEREGKAIWSSLSPPAQEPLYIFLDYVIRINREACEGLVRLLHCSCARSPHLALLYISAFTRVLMWYRQAAAHSIGNTTQPCGSGADTPVSTAASDAWQPRHDSTASAHGPPPVSVCAKPQSQQHVFGPSQMAMGSITISDQRIKKVLELQLLSSEMRKAARVIDLFALLGSGGHNSVAQGPDSLGGIDNLYVSLSSWLRGEHIKAAHVINSELASLSMTY